MAIIFRNISSSEYFQTQKEFSQADDYYQTEIFSSLISWFAFFHCEWS
jgi:hypothetical protein